MDIGSLTDITSNTATESSSAVSGLTSDFDAFINLLTTQVTNQDPTEPLDSTQFVEQLATFSNLEQQVATNSHLETIVELLQSSLTTTAQSLLGEQVAASAVTIDGGFAAQSIAADGVTNGRLVVQNAAGETVFEGPEASQWSWDGTLTNGTPAAPGTYSFSIATENGPIDAKMIGTVESVVSTVEGEAVTLSPGVSSSVFEHTS